MQFIFLIVYTTSVLSTTSPPKDTFARLAEDYQKACPPAATDTTKDVQRNLSSFKRKPVFGVLNKVLAQARLYSHRMWIEAWL